MIRSLTRLLPLIVLTLLALAIPATAQTAAELEELLKKLREAIGSTGSVYGPDLEDPSFESLFKKDETGLWQWKKAKRKPCPIKIEVTQKNKKTKEVHPKLCRHCGGKRRELDHSQEAPCLVCKEGEYNCHLCAGRGRIVVSGTFSSPAPASCVGCGGKGKFKCTVCKGKRVVTFGRIGGKKIRDAEQKELKGRLKELETAQEDFDAIMVLEGPIAVTKSMKVASKIKFAPGHISLMAKLMKRQGQLNGFQSGDTFTDEVRDRFRFAVESQLEREVAILKFAIQRFEKNKNITPSAPKEPAKKK